MTKTALDDKMSELQDSRFSLTEELRKNSVSNTHSEVIKLKNSIEEIDTEIEDINNTKYKEMK